MKFNWKNYLFAGTTMFGALFLSDLQAQQSTKEKMHFEDSISSELKKYPTTTHFIYEIIWKNN